MSKVSSFLNSSKFNFSLLNVSKCTFELSDYSVCCKNGAKEEFAKPPDSL